MASQTLNSERLAQFVAIELLYPYEKRGGDKDLFENDDITLEELSDSYEIPLEMIALALHSGIHDLLGKCWDFISADEANPARAAT